MLRNGWSVKTALSIQSCARTPAVAQWTVPCLARAIPHNESRGYSAPSAGSSARAKLAQYQAQLIDPSRPLDLSRRTAKPKKTKKIHKEPQVAWSSLNLLPGLIEPLQQHQLEHPTEIQRLAVPAILNGENVTIASQTGSGKTLAYLLPIIQNMKRDEFEGVRIRIKRPRVLVLVPNRELASQVLAVAKALCHGVKFRATAISGGESQRQQRLILEGTVDLLIATPGRLQQLCDKRELFLTDVQYLVIDECDTMYTPENGFVEVLNKVLAPIYARNSLPGAKATQIVLASASISKAASRQLASQFPRSRTLSAASLHTTPRSLQHSFVTVGQQDKKELLLQLLHKESKAWVSHLQYDAHDKHHERDEHNDHDEDEDGNDVERRVLGQRVKLMQRSRKKAIPLGERGMGARNRDWAQERSQDWIEGERERNRDWVQDEQGRQMAREMDEGQYEVDEEEEMEEYEEGEMKASSEDDEEGEMKASSEAKSEAEAWSEEQKQEDAEYYSDLSDVEAQEEGEDYPDYVPRSYSPSPSSSSSSHRYPLPPTIVFCNTIQSCRFVEHVLFEAGFATTCYHGGILPQTRANNYQAFLDGSCDVLVSTDMASRGLDTRFVRHVVMFDFPLSPVDHLHRAGRTARAGKMGRVTSLVARGDRVLAEAIKRATEQGRPIDSLSADRLDYRTDVPNVVKQAATPTQRKQAMKIFQEQLKQRKLKEKELSREARSSGKAVKTEVIKLKAKGKLPDKLRPTSLKALNHKVNAMRQKLGKLKKSSTGTKSYSAVARKLKEKEQRLRDLQLADFIARGGLRAQPQVDMRSEWSKERAKDQPGVVPRFAEKPAGKSHKHTKSTPRGKVHGASVGGARLRTGHVGSGSRFGRNQYADGTPRPASSSSASRSSKASRR